MHAVKGLACRHFYSAILRLDFNFAVVHKCLVRYSDRSLTFQQIKAVCLILTPRRVWLQRNMWLARKSHVPCNGLQRGRRRNNL